MLNKFASLLLVSTSLSPMLGAMAVKEFGAGKDWYYWVPWLVPAVMLAAICWLVLFFAERRGQVSSLELAEIERSDKEVVSFLLAYLLPVVSAKDTAFQAQWLTSVYVFVILVLVFSHACALHFNPVMGLLGYHFYAVRDKTGRSRLLISRSELHRKDEEIRVVYIAPTICLHTERP